MFFLSGWTFALYMMLPVIRIFFGSQPLASSTADQFLLHFAPYFCISLVAVAVAGAGSYTFDAFALLFATFFVQVAAALSVLVGRRGRFVVTAKRGADRAQPGAILPTLMAMSLLLAAMGYGLMSFTAASLNNVAFVFLHLSVLAVGSWTALVGRRGADARTSRRDDRDRLGELVA